MDDGGYQYLIDTFHVGAFHLWIQPQIEYSVVKF